MLVILVLWWAEARDCKFNLSMGNLVRLYLSQNKRKAEDVAHSLLKAPDLTRHRTSLTRTGKDLEKLVASV